MKPPLVNSPVSPPAPSDTSSPPAKTGPDGTDTEQDAGAPESGTPDSNVGLVGSYGPLVKGPEPSDADGAGADERRKP